MSRQSGDQLAADGSILNGFDYQLQVWVIDGRVDACAHPASMRRVGPCCNQERYAAKLVNTITGHEVRRGTVEPPTMLGQKITWEEAGRISADGV